MSRAAYALRACLEHLVPGAIFDECDNDYALTVWKDARPMPTDAECAAAWPAVQAAQAESAQAAATASANERTIGQALDAALAANQTAIATLVAWRTNGAGAGTANLTAAQLSAALRTEADNQIAQFRQLNGLIRIVRRNLATADLSTSAKV